MDMRVPQGVGEGVEKIILRSDKHGVFVTQAIPRDPPMVRVVLEEVTVFILDRQERFLVGESYDISDSSGSSKVRVLLRRGQDYRSLEIDLKVLASFRMYEVGVIWRAYLMERSHPLNAGYSVIKKIPGEYDLHRIQDVRTFLHGVEFCFRIERSIVLNQGPP